MWRRQCCLNKVSLLSFSLSPSLLLLLLAETGRTGSSDTPRDKWPDTNAMCLSGRTPRSSYSSSATRVAEATCLMFGDLEGKQISRSFNKVFPCDLSIFFEYFLRVSRLSIAANFLNEANVCSTRSRSTDDDKDTGNRLSTDMFMKITFFVLFFDYF